MFFLFLFLSFFIDGLTLEHFLEPISSALTSFTGPHELKKELHELLLEEAQDYRQTLVVQRLEAWWVEQDTTSSSGRD